MICCIAGAMAGYVGGVLVASGFLLMDKARRWRAMPESQDIMTKKQTHVRDKYHQISFVTWISEFFSCRDIALITAYHRLRLLSLSSGLSDDLVDLLRLQRRFLFQLATPCHQGVILAPSLCT